MALMVKSRRAASSRQSAVQATSAWRPSVADVAAQAGDLDRFVVQHGGHRAMREAGLEHLQPGGFQPLGDGLRRQRRGDVHVMHRQPRQHVAHRAAHRPGARQRRQHRRRGAPRQHRGRGSGPWADRRADRRSPAASAWPGTDRPSGARIGRDIDGARLQAHPQPVPDGAPAPRTIPISKQPHHRPGTSCPGSTSARPRRRRRAPGTSGTRRDRARRLRGIGTRPGRELLHPSPADGANPSARARD